jgi:hypothetical protein
VINSQHPKNKTIIHFFAFPGLLISSCPKSVNALFYSELKGIGPLFATGRFNAGIALALYLDAARRLCCGKVVAIFGDLVEMLQTI